MRIMMNLIVIDDGTLLFFYEKHDTISEKSDMLMGIVSWKYMKKYSSEWMN